MRFEKLFVLSPKLLNPETLNPYLDPRAPTFLRVAHYDFFVYVLKKVGCLGLRQSQDQKRGQFSRLGSLLRSQEWYGTVVNMILKGTLV